MRILRSSPRGLQLASSKPAAVPETSLRDFRDRHRCWRRRGCTSRLAPRLVPPRTAGHQAERVRDSDGYWPQNSPLLVSPLRDAARSIDRRMVGVRKPSSFGLCGAVAGAENRGGIKWARAGGVSGASRRIPSAAIPALTIQCGELAAATECFSMLRFGRRGVQAAQPIRSRMFGGRRHTTEHALLAGR